MPDMGHDVTQVFDIGVVRGFRKTGEDTLQVACALFVMR
jgi:hypothetical protein